MSPVQVILLLLLCGVTACSPDPRVIAIEVTPGHETDAFRQDPPITNVAVTVYDVDGVGIAAATTAPGGAFALGELPLDTFVRFEVSARDASATIRMRGRSLGLRIGELATDLLPIFTQRLDELSRPPGKLLRSHVDAVAAAVGERYLILAGGSVIEPDGQSGDPAGATFYDLLSLKAASGGAFSVTPRSLLISRDGNAALVLGDDSASWVDFADGRVEEVALPEGLASFADVAGGQIVEGADASYVVGPTRSAAPSDRVLVVAADRSISVATLTAARQGAAASWVDPVGLVVVAGSATAVGAEVLSPTATGFAPRAFPPDDTSGAAAVATGTADQLLLIGGQGASASIRAIAANCTGNCEATVLGAELPVALDAARAFMVEPGKPLVVGSDPSDGQTRVFTLDLASQAVTEVPLKEPRVGAAVTATFRAMGRSSDQPEDDQKSDGDDSVRKAD